MHRNTDLAGGVVPAPTLSCTKEHTSFTLRSADHAHHSVVMEPSTMNPVAVVVAPNVHAKSSTAPS